MTSEEGRYSQETTFCSWCGGKSVVVYVHGHGRCSLCATNIDSCCQGAPGVSVGIGNRAGMAELVDARDLKSLVL